MTRARIVVLAGALLLGAFALAQMPMPPVAAADLDCRDFPNQAAAQAHLRANPGDPDRLDADRDGIACESLPCPCDKMPVNRDVTPSAPQAPPTAPPPVAAPPGAPGPAPSSPATARRSPMEFLDVEGLIPPGFVHQPDKDQALTRGDVNGLFRGYLRPNPDVAPDDVTGLGVLALVGASTPAADRFFAVTLDALIREGFAAEPLDGILGDRAVVLRKTIDEEGDRESESLIIQFQIGQLVGGVEWLDYIDLPNYDYALDVALTLAARMQELGATR